MPQADQPALRPLGPQDPREVSGYRLLARIGQGGMGTVYLTRTLGGQAQALHSVHSASVIHRDLKPSNILLASDGPWVIDFGIARATDTTQLTQTGAFIGTPQYMSPEHTLGQHTTPATDVFALGLIAAVTATGRHPYGDGAPMSIAARIANTELRPPDLTGYPAPLRPLLEACLAADPAARPTPADLAEQCQRLSGRPLREFTDWLPAPLTAAITRRARDAGLRPSEAAPPPEQPPRDDQHHPASPTAQATRPPLPSPPTAVLTQAAPAPAPARRRRTTLITSAALALALIGGTLWAVWFWRFKDRSAEGSSLTSDHPGVRYEMLFGRDTYDMYTGIDLDSPPHGVGSTEEIHPSPTGEELRFPYRAFGKAEGPSFEQCAKAAEHPTLPRTIPAYDLNAEGSPIEEGDTLCGRTSDNRLAMVRINKITPHDEATMPRYQATITLWKRG
ncbi:hypothetical protein ACZ90_50175 [Streptomyces albus subsp. albus]|nr:hypothetical protein ACZ90_50175 [Streptomyces albus subsp. albus]